MLSNNLGEKCCTKLLLGPKKRRFCEKSSYSYNDTVVDKILREEGDLHKKLKSTSQNAFRYRSFLKTVGKLVIAWNAVCMVYYGILLGDSSGGILMGNLYLGLASFVVGPLTNILMTSKYAFRRPIISTQFALGGIGCIALAYLDIYHSKRYVNKYFIFLVLVMLNPGLLRP